MQGNPEHDQDPKERILVGIVPRHSRPIQSGNKSSMISLRCSRSGAFPLWRKGWPMLALVVSVLPGSASASEPQVGRWAVDAQSCGGGGDTHHSAPLTVTPTSLRWAAESCAI